MSDPIITTFRGIPISEIVRMDHELGETLVEHMKYQEERIKNLQQELDRELFRSLDRITKKQ